MADVPVAALRSELETVDQELQAVMSGSRLLLEEMTTLLHLHSPRGNRRTVSDRRTGWDRRNGQDRRAVARAREAQETGVNDPGRRRTDRRDTPRDRRLPLDARQDIITREMNLLAERNAFLLQRKRTLLDTHRTVQ